MPVDLSILHDFHSPVSDGPDPDHVQPSHWNEEHEIALAAAGFLGATAAGPVTGLSPSEAATLLDLAATYQPLDADLAAIAALTTTPYGRSLLELADETALEALVDTLPNLTSIQGRTVALVDAGANAFWGWDDTAGAYENLTASEALEIIKTVDGSGSGLDADLLDGQSSAFYATATSVSDHLADPTGAHAASAISYNGNSGLSATDVEAALDELDNEKQPLDADLTAIAALTTTSYGRSLLELADETALEALLGTLPNLTSIQGRTVTLADAGFDALFGWDDSASAYKNFLLADIATEASPAAGDYALIYGAEGDLRKVDWSTVGAGGGATTALDNLASVAINTTLVSDTNNTDDLGTSAIAWRTGYFGTSIELGHASDTTLTRAAAGRLAVEGVNVVTTSSTDTLTNKTLTSPVIDTDITIPNTGLHLLDTNASHDLIIAPGSDLSADRTLTIATGDANRTLTLGGDVSINGAATQADQETATSTTTFVSPGRQHFHPGHPKAWGVAGVTGTVLASYGVLSITDGGAGIGTFNLTTAFSSVNWAAGIGARAAGTVIFSSIIGANTNSLEIRTYDAAGTLTDGTNYQFVGCGDQA